MLEDNEAAPRAQLRIYLLGEPYLVDVKANREIALSSRCLTLVAFLLLNRKVRLRENIAAKLWPDVSECEGRAILRRVLHQLVRALPEGGGPWLSIGSQRLEWNASAPFWCDVDAFERSSRTTDTHVEAAGLYGGDLLAGDESEWVVERRARLRECQLDMLHALAEASQQRGNRAAAVTYWRRLLSLDPFREDAFRSLFVVRSASGDRAGAASEYLAFVRFLRAELGVGPMPETVACFEGILNATGYAVAGADGR